MTPDELPADMEAAVEADILYAGKGPLAVTRTTNLRALLKAYQERGRALERLANKDNEFGSEVQKIARAALNQKGDER
jgi:hypothetical protein